MTNIKLLQIFYSDPEALDLDVAKRLMTLCDRFDQSGRSSYEATTGGILCSKLTEPYLSALASPIIQALFPFSQTSNEMIVVAHQLPCRHKSKSETDGTIVKITKTGMYTLGLFEWGLRDSARKQGQVFSYHRSHHASYFQESGNAVFRQLNVILSPAGSLELRVVYDSGDGKTFTDLLLFQTTKFSVQDLAATLHTVRVWANGWDSSKSEKINWKSRENTRTLLQEGKNVYKIFDFRYQREQTRSPLVAIQHNLYPGLEVCVPVVFVWYLFICC
jgi:hypothetical protein